VAFDTVQSGVGQGVGCGRISRYGGPAAQQAYLMESLSKISRRDQEIDAGAPHVGVAGVGWVDRARMRLSRPGVYRCHRCDGRWPYQMMTAQRRTGDLRIRV